MDIAQFFDVFLHLDRHLEAVVAQYGPWVYAGPFAIVSVGTGLVVMPFLPGDSVSDPIGSRVGPPPAVRIRRSCPWAPADGAGSVAGCRRRSRRRAETDSAGCAACALRPDC